SIDWQDITPEGTDGSFSLPKPVTHRQDQVHDVYEAKLDKCQIQVGVYPRRLVPAQPGTSDAELLNQFEQNIIAQIQGNLTAAGKNPQFSFEGNVPTKNGLAQQTRIRVQDEFILNQFYITPKTLYCIKIDNGDKTNPNVAKFLDSFTP